MDPFHLTEEAILDIDSIWLYLLEKDGVGTADRMNRHRALPEFFRLAEIPESGHRRTDLTNRDVLFYRVLSWLIIYQPGSSSLQILQVLHGKRNLTRILTVRI